MCFWPYLASTLNSLSPFPLVTGMWKALSHAHLPCVALGCVATTPRVSDLSQAFCLFLARTSPFAHWLFSAFNSHCQTCARLCCFEQSEGEAGSGDKQVGWLDPPWVVVGKRPEGKVKAKGWRAQTQTKEREMHPGICHWNIPKQRIEQSDPSCCRCLRGPHILLCLLLTPLSSVPSPVVLPSLPSLDPHQSSLSANGRWVYVFEVFLPLVLLTTVTLHVAACKIAPEYNFNHVNLCFGIFQWQIHGCISRSLVCVWALRPLAFTFPSGLFPTTTQGGSSQPTCLSPEPASPWDEGIPSSASTL